MVEDIKILGPLQVETPDLINDVRKYFFEDKSEEEVKSIIEGLREKERKKVILVTERFEFIDHLIYLIKILKNKKKLKINKYDSDEKVRIIEKTELFEKEFDGFDHDIESLCYYLLLTCIDTMKGQPEYKDFYEWLVKECDKRYVEGEPISFTKHEYEQYREKYGLRKNFIKAITNELPENLRNRAVLNFAVVSLDDQKVESNSYCDWNAKSNEQKLKKLAVKLYDDRSRYTHASIRSFLPNIPVEFLSRKKDVIVQLVPGDNMCNLLKDMVIYIVRKNIEKSKTI